MPTADSPPAEVQQLTGSSSSRVTSRPPTTATQADVGDEGHPDEFKEFTDQQLQSKITRLRALHFRTADGGEKARMMVHRVEKELDRRRAAGLMRKDVGDADELKKFTDQDLRLKNKRLHALDGSTPSSGKKLRKVEKELDRQHASGVEPGQSQAAQTPNVDDPYASVQQGENTSDHAHPVDSKATDGGLNPFASTNTEGEGATGINLGSEVEPKTSTCAGQKGEDSGKRDKHSQTARVRETNLEFKIKQTQKLVEEVKETPKQEDRFRIEKCVSVLESIKELTDMEKAKALKLFKCGLNREIFMTTKSTSVRLIWLKSEIYA